MPTRAKMISYKGVKILKIISYPAAQTCVAHIWEYPPPPELFPKLQEVYTDLIAILSPTGYQYYVIWLKGTRTLPAGARRHRTDIKCNQY